MFNKKMLQGLAGVMGSLCLDLVDGIDMKGSGCIFAILLHDYIVLFEVLGF